MEDYWEIEQGRVNSAQFFEALWKHFPEATTFYAEGTSISRDVKDCYLLYADEGPYVAKTQTLFPRPAKFRCHFSRSLTAALSALARRHAEPELLDHLALYKGTDPLVLWPDAFANVLLVSRRVPEAVVLAFAADVGLSCTDV